MIDKFVHGMAEAMAGIQDGATILLGGFGSVGQADALVDGLIDHGARDLTVVANNAGAGRVGLARLLELGRVRRVVCSYPRSAGAEVFVELYRAGKIELELVPQGTLAERIRAGGAGLGGILTPTGVGTVVAEGKQVIAVDGRDYLLETPLRADVALLHCYEADYYANLTYRLTAQNFNPLMAMAADTVIAEPDEVVPIGVIPPDHVRTPGIIVTHLVERPH